MLNTTTPPRMRFSTFQIFAGQPVVIGKDNKLNAGSNDIEREFRKGGKHNFGLF